MSRLILLGLLVAVVVAFVAIALSWLRDTSRRAGQELQHHEGRVGVLQQVSWGLLMLVMTGVATGWLGAD